MMRGGTIGGEGAERGGVGERMAPRVVVVVVVMLLETLHEAVGYWTLTQDPRTQHLL